MLWVGGGHKLAPPHANVWEISRHSVDRYIRYFARYDSQTWPFTNSKVLVPAVDRFSLHSQFLKLKKLYVTIKPNFVHHKLSIFVSFVYDRSNIAKVLTAKDHQPMPGNFA